MDSKLCPSHTTRFKRSSSSRNSETLSTSLAMREVTFFKKAYELSTLCDIEVCVLYYNREGDLVKTWPEDKAKVKDMAFRFSQLSEREKSKKNTNLSECLAKKMSQEKKNNFHKYSQKLLEMEASLVHRLPILEDRLWLLEDQSRQQLTEPLTNPIRELLPLSVPSGYGILQPLIDLPTSLVDDPSHQQPCLSDLPSSNLHHDPTKFSVYVLNHDNGKFTQLGSSLDQRLMQTFSSYY